MGMQLEKLFFSIDLLDRVTGPIGKLQKRINRFSRSVTADFRRIGVGSLAATGAALALQKMVNPAIEVNRALGEVKSLGTTQEALDKLSDTAVDFTMKYGGAASEVISSAYDIQSGIDGLAGSDLARFTNASNVLAKGTKADAETITSYMGTMYGIFENTAKKMGKAQWVEQLTGQTATAVKMFKTTGAGMASAFESLGANATTAGVDVAEQMGILGTLQSSMSGSEAGTKYRAFLAHIGTAQEKLGLSFTDDDGNMLGMIEILEKLKTKYGDTKKAANLTALQTAFGDEALGLITNLMGKTTGLSESIDKLGKVTGMEQAEQMAADMTDTWQRLGAVVKAIRVMFAQTLVPVIMPVVEWMEKGGKTIVRWQRMFPNLAKAIGLAAVAMAGLVGGFGLLLVAGGLVSLGMTAWIGVTTAWTWASSVLSGALGVLTSVIGFLCSPIFLTIAAMALLAAGVWLVIRYWGDMWAWFSNTAFWLSTAGIVSDFVDHIVAKWQTMMDFFSFIIDGIVAGWEMVTNFLTNFDWLDWLGQKFDWLTSKLDWLPGFGSEEETMDTPSLSAPRQTNVPQGGIGRQITQSINSSRSSSNTRSIGSVTVNTSRNITPAHLDEMVFLATG